MESLSLSPPPLQLYWGEPALSAAKGGRDGASPALASGGAKA
jgi:hypothetical protein